MHVVTLVHGTWAKKAGWTQPGSALRCRLKTALGADAEIRVFPWSARNSFAARSHDSHELRKYLSEGLHLFPQAEHSIIAHSHGGNLILSALEDDSLRTAGFRVVTLSTPFITVAPRDLSNTLEPLMLIAFLTSVVLLISVEALGFVLSSSTNAIEGEVLAFLNFAALVWIVARRRRIKQFFRDRFETRTNTFLEQNRRRPSDDLELLVIRPSADEASGGLIFLQFLSWLIARSWSLLTSVHRFPRAVSNAFERWVETYVFRIVAVTSVLAFILLGASSSEMALPYRIALCAVGTPVVGILIYLALFTSIYVAFWIIVVTAVVPASLLLVPTMFLLMLFGLPLGVASPLAIVLTKTSVEASPVGASYIAQLPPIPSNYFMHSLPYQDPDSVRITVEWLLQRRPSTPQSQHSSAPLTTS